MIEAIRRAFAKKAAMESQPAAPITKTVAAPATRNWSNRDYPHPATPRVEAMVETRKSIHYRLISRTGK